MRVYLMRHATAEEAGVGPDAGRRLTEQGRREAREAGEALRDRKAKLAVILTSPRMRARETAELVARVLGGIPIEVRERLGGGAPAAAYLDDLPDQELLVVGHNPEISAVASGLAGRAVSFRPSTVCCFDCNDEGARLEWVRNPDQRSQE